MSQNLLKRLITSIILLSLLIFINFSHQYIFILSILIIGLMICLEANNIFSKILINNYIKKNSPINKLNIKFVMLNMITFSYIFLIKNYISMNTITFNEDLIFFFFIIFSCFRWNY